MKPDASIDYYALLGVANNATEEEIKKAYRKQALLHHPDRNAGKEEEAKARFQDIQAAYDTLSDKTRRDKYDRERLKRGYLFPRPAAATKPSTSAPPQTPYPREARQTRATAGASRYADFTDPARASSNGSDADASYNTYKAWQSMRGAHKPANYSTSQPKATRPAPTAQRSSRARSDWDEAQYASETARTARGQPARTPRKAGFDPYAADAQDEPSSRRTSAYYNVSHGQVPQASQPHYPQMPPQTDTPMSRPNPIRSEASRSKQFYDPASNFYSSDRVSTPYASKSGERTYFSSAGLARSASTAAKMNNLGSSQRDRATPDRHRSASPRTRSPRQAKDDTSPSASEDEVYADRMKQSQQNQAYSARRGSADPRSGGKVTVEDNPDDIPTGFSRPQRHRTWDSQDSPMSAGNKTFAAAAYRLSAGGDAQTQTQRPGPQDPSLQSPISPLATTKPWTSTAKPSPLGEDLSQPASRFTPSRQLGVKTDDVSAGSKKRPPLYAYWYSPFASRFGRLSQSTFSVATHCGQEAAKTQQWPYWAIPSSVMPSKPASKVNSSVHEYVSFANSSDNANNSMPSANLASSNNRFSLPSSSSSSTSPSKNPSTEDVNTQFSPPGWHGKFTGAADYLAPESVVGKTTRGRASPPKRPMPRTYQTSPPGIPSDGSSTSARKMPPPPPQQPQPTSPTQNQNHGQNPVQSPTKFMPEEWNKHFKEPTWAMPAPPPPATSRPISTPRSRSGKRTGPAKRRPAAGSSFAAFEDTGDDGDDEARQSSSNLDTEPELSHCMSGNAMDIDSGTPPGATEIPSTESTTSSIPSTTINGGLPSVPPVSFPKPPQPTQAQGFNMQPLKSAYPLSGTSSGAGLNALKSDLTSTLPFESAPASNLASVATPLKPRPQRLELPAPPKPPLAPMKCTSEACDFYMKHVAAYMREFHAFNGKMLGHFRARQVEMEAMTMNSASAAEKGFLPMVNGMGGGGVAGDVGAWSWMGARGDEGFLKYSAWLEEDRRVRMHWTVAWDKHEEAIKELGRVRNGMKGMIGRIG